MKKAMVLSLCLILLSFSLVFACVTDDDCSGSSVCSNDGDCISCEDQNFGWNGEHYEDNTYASGVLNDVTGEFPQWDGGWGNYYDSCINGLLYESTCELYPEGGYVIHEIIDCNDPADNYNANNKDYDTPIGKGERTIVVGGGNVAMDAARSARRLGSDVTIVYRRSFEEMPARLDEIHHAKEEGIKFMILTNPVAILGDNSVTGIRCVQMKLDEPDESGRRKPIPMINSDFTMNCDQVLVAIGTTPNPLLVKESGLKHSIKGAILVNESTQTSDPQIYAGGDIIGGNATVIQAMGEGKVAARSIHNKLSE